MPKVTLSQIKDKMQRGATSQQHATDQGGGTFKLVRGIHQQKEVVRDSDGKPVKDADGKIKRELVTYQAPATFESKIDLVARHGEKFKRVFKPGVQVEEEIDEDDDDQIEQSPAADVEDDTEESEEEAPDDDDEEDLSSMNADQLREVAENEGIDVTGKKTKASLIKAITEAREAE